MQKNIDIMGELEQEVLQTEDNSESGGTEEEYKL